MLIMHNPGFNGLQKRTAIANSVAIYVRFTGVYPLAYILHNIIFVYIATLQFINLENKYEFERSMILCAE